MMKSELNSTDIYSDSSDNDNEILLKIEGADKNWASLFLNSEGSDFKIRHKDFQYAVHRNVIFKNISLHVLDQVCEEGYLSLPDNCNPELVQGVISALYSLQLKICRTQALEVLDIIHCLHIPKLQKLLEEDIKNNIEEYELFTLLQKSIFMGMASIQQLCLNQLQSESYEQMRYEKFQLLNCKQQTFKFVVHHYKEKHWQNEPFNEGDKCIQEIIQQYCKHNNYNEKDRCRLIKDINQTSVVQDFPTFSKVTLTPLKLNDNNQSQMGIKQLTPRTYSKESGIPKIKSQSPYNQHCNSSKSMIVDLTYMGIRKRRASRSSEHNCCQSKIASDYILLKQQNREMSSEGEKMRECLEKMAKTLKQKQGEHRNNKFKLGEIEGILQQCQKQLMEEHKSLMLLDVRLDKVTMNQISKDANDIQSSDSSDQEDKTKSSKTQDKKLRCSLIESRWLVY